MFAQLGDHIFEGLKLPGSLSDNRGARYGRVALVNGKDALQFTGEELTEISLSIVYSVEFCDPTTEINCLRQSMKSAEVLPFLMGDGSVVGKYVIESVDMASQRYSPAGVLEIASVTVNLLEYAAGDAPEPKGIAVISSDSTASANTTPVPTAQPPAKPVESPAQEVTKSISKAQNAVNKMKEIGKKVKNKTAQVKRAVRDVRQLADDVKQAYSTAKTKVENTKKIIKRASELPTSLDGALKYAENLAKLDNVTDVSVLKMNIDEMSAAADKVSVSAAPVVAFSATKEGDK